MNEDGPEPLRSPKREAGDGGGRWKTHALLAVVQLAFASQAVEAKIAMSPREAGGEAISPQALAMTRMLGAAIFFQILTRATGWMRPTTPRDKLELLGLSVLGIALNQALFLLGLHRTTPTAAGLLAVTIPVFAAGIAVIIGQERPSLQTFAGLALAIGGVVWLTGIGTFDSGAAIVTMNSLSYACYIVFSRSLIRRLGAFTAIAWLFTWGALLFAPVGVPALVAGAAGWSTRGWGYVGYIILVPTIVAYLANAMALGRSSASIVAVYICLQPLLVAAWARIRLGHTVSARMAVSAALILLGVGIVAARRASAPPEPRLPLS